VRDKGNGSSSVFLTEKGVVDEGGEGRKRDCEKNLREREKGEEKRSHGRVSVSEAFFLKQEP